MLNLHTCNALTAWNISIILHYIYTLQRELYTVIDNVAKCNVTNKKSYNYFMVKKILPFSRGQK